MSRKSRRVFSEEFKAQAVALVESGRSASEVARELGVCESSLFRWKQQRMKPSKIKASYHNLEEENRQLRQQLRRVEQEREILKKSIALFVKTGS